jgi:cell wall-associated NlpC family hydrolase
MSTASVATVTRLTSWLRGASGRAIVEVSEGTRLPVLARGPTSVAVASPTHVRLFVRTSDVVVRRPAQPALPATASGVVATARTFLGVGYLWGGRSGFAVDCSGLTQLAYKLHGRTIPRDTDDQARAGRAAALSALLVGDLVLFREGSTIGHVGLYVGSGRMLHAPHTGSTVRLAPIGSPALARRIL